MLLLIGGAPGIGKSTVAHEVARELGLPRLVDTDLVRDILRIQSREQDDPMLFRNALSAWQVHGDATPAGVIAGLQSHLRPLIGATTRLLDSYLSTGKSAIFHGVPLLPSHFARYQTRGVQIALLAAPSEEDYRKRLAERGLFRAGRLPGHEHLETGWVIHQHLVADATAAGVPVVTVDTESRAACALLRRIRS
jgi:2-phosphoglycerate kinase